MAMTSFRLRSWAPQLIAVLLIALAVGEEAQSSVPPRLTTSLTATDGSEARAVRAARAAQNRAIARLDTAAVASFWTDDVEIRRGLGSLVTGRDAYVTLTCAGTGCASEAAP